MSMYVLQVLTGQETALRDKLTGKGIQAYCPQERRLLRLGGRQVERLYTLYPGYLFVRCKSVISVYHAIKKEAGVLYWLGLHNGTVEALSPQEEANILWLAGDGPLPPSEPELQADGSLDFTSGPLARLAEHMELRRVMLRERRAVVNLPLHGQEKTMRLSFVLTDPKDDLSNP